WYSVQADLERELAQDEFKRSVGQPLADLERTLAEETQALRRELDANAQSRTDEPRTDEPRTDTAPPDDGAFPTPTPLPAPTPRDPPP
ncbi:MAG: Sec-independent protein translocase protein TatB, partial [Arenimonas sp.]